MKSKELINELFRDARIAEDCNLCCLCECLTSKEFDDQIRCYFGDDVCEIITPKPKTEIGDGTYVYGYTGMHILERMPDIILVLYSEDGKEDGKCVFMWRIEDY